MNAVQSECPGPDRQLLSSLLSDVTVRRLLCRLQSGPATPLALATSLAASERGCSPAAVPAEERQRYRRRLHHDYLPRLEAADFIDHSGGGLVRATPVRTDRFDVPLPSFDEPDDPTWTAAATLLARGYRYPLLTLLAEADGPVPLSVLAANLADTISGADTTPRELSVSLHHVDLPKLEAVGVATYDPKAKTATATRDARALL